VIALFPAFALLTAIAIGALLWPVFRPQSSAPRRSFEVEVYRDQLAEIEHDRERGVIGPEEARGGRLEVERRLLRAAGQGPEAPAESGAGNRLLLLAAALLVPTLAAALYAGLGSPSLPDQPLAQRQDETPQAPGQPDVQKMVANLEARLAQTPDDLEGWLMLGRSRGVLGSSQGAAEAFRRALALSANDPRAIGGLGEALTDVAGGVVTPEAKSLFTRLGEVEPSDPRTLFYLGWADSQAGDNKAALKRWQELLAATPADAPWRPRVVEAIQAAAIELKLDPAAVLAQIPTPSAAAPAAPQPSAADVAAAAAMPADDRMAMIRGMVEKLQARMDADGSDVEGWLRLAQSRLVLGESDKARATFERALALHPDDPALLKGYGGTLLGPVRPDTGLPEVGDRANELFTKAAGLQPDDPELWWYLGIRAMQHGNKAQARTAWEKVLTSLDPSQPEYKDIKSRLDGLGS
jgi:cytochrome c-type biogenesis protein CcmH